MPLWTQVIVVAAALGAATGALWTAVLLRRADAQLARIDRHLEHISAKATIGASASLRNEEGAAIVASDLAAAHDRANAVVASHDDAAGAAADAAARTEP